MSEGTWDPFDQVAGDLTLREGRRHLREGYGVVPVPSGRASEAASGPPALMFTDGPRGVVVPGGTCFPVSMARGATWDVELEERIGEAMGIESRAVGANLNAGVCINVLRHPGWGRAQETYGEDPHHLGAMGVALVTGMQRHVMACVKHFACNSVENTRFWVDVRIDERTLREVYLPHFRACVRAGAASVMSAYNRINGRFCGGNRLLLQTILKEEWGFEGFVLSDFFLGAHSPKDIARGLDIEMPFPIHFGRRLRRAVRAGRVPEEAVRAAAGRIVAMKRRFADVGNEELYGAAALGSDAHRALARECAHKAMVLLENEPVDGTPVLPLPAGASVALIGRLADLPNTGDRGSSRVRSEGLVTARQALEAALGQDLVRFHDGRDLFDAAAHAATCDCAVLVVGLTHRDEGEAMIGPWGPGGDRDRLRLRGHDEALIQEVVARNPRTVVVLVAGSALVTEAWRADVPAILMAWYAGLEGGRLWLICSRGWSLRADGCPVCSPGIGTTFRRSIRAPPPSATATCTGIATSRPRVTSRRFRLALGCPTPASSTAISGCRRIRSARTRCCRSRSMSPTWGPGTETRWFSSMSRPWTRWSVPVLLWTFGASVGCGSPLARRVGSRSIWPSPTWGSGVRTAAGGSSPLDIGSRWAHRRIRRSTWSRPFGWSGRGRLPYVIDRRSRLDPESHRSDPHGRSWRDLVGQARLGRLSMGLARGG